jgi:hypothetical protein
LLRIPDVGRDDFIERETMVRLFEFVSENLSFDSELATHSVLYFLEGGVEAVYSEWTHY